ncbi:MAG: DUF883 family protein [Prosthecobacter sp.]|uniref:DUF883 family protein n=1 Tax=Prosthecobacter sp. TaxID=1965333 RepID=UPI0019EDF66A|nr:hypothetical protein [Prosthecobacter sp.]MBE2283868.1 DUF883 family protein [Prosthecobacter sp.]
MRTTFFSGSPTTDTLRKDVRVLAEDTAKMARERVLDPAVEAVNRAGSKARHAMHDAQDRLSKQFNDAERYASQQYERTERWVSANPVTAIGIAFAVGVVISAFLRSSKH